MKIDHLFIFSNQEGKEADDLVNFGLVEGSSRVHQGQGTTNRKFYFQNFFLEVLWVHNQAEIKSELVKPTGLWQRTDKESGFSPFGLCLVNTADTNDLFEKAYQYQPNYFSKGMEIDILNNEKAPSLPWTFRLPFKEKKGNPLEPTNHSNGLSELTEAIFEYQNQGEAKSYLTCLKKEHQIKFKPSNRNWLNLKFDGGKQNKQKDFDELKLTIRY